MKTKLKSFARRHTKGLIACLVAVTLVVGQIPISYAVDELSELAAGNEAAQVDEKAAESVAVAPEEDQDKAAEESGDPADESATVEEEAADPAASEPEEPKSEADDPAAKEEPKASEGKADQAAASDEDDEDLTAGTVSNKLVDSVTYGSNYNIPRTVSEEATGPAHSKTLTDNGDGTYKLTLSVTGKTSSESSSNKADVIVVFDKSGSMEGNRLSTAKSAVNSLAEQLLKNNTTTDVSSAEVTLSLVSFSNVAKTDLNKTTSLSTFKNKVNGYSAKGGTNWEDALQEAAGISVRSGATKYVIFVSDGNPTFRNTQGGEYNRWGKWVEWEDKYDSYYKEYGVWGTGSDEDDTTVSRCYNMAKDDAKALVDAGAELYCVGAFGSVDRMKQLATDSGAGVDNYYSASNQTALNMAFAEIINKINASAAFKNVTVTDGITGLTATQSDLKNVDTSSFTYTRSDGKTYDGGKATYDGNTVTWSLGENYKIEDGVTVSLSFNVWPKQEAYDLVAALNNGEKSYNELTADQKKQIVQVGSGYGLKTNISDPAPSITYTQELKKTTTSKPDGYVSGQPASDGYTYTYANGVYTGYKYVEGNDTFANPDPISLDVAKMTVQKNWTDDLTNGSDRPSSVELVVYQDNTIIKTLTLSAENDWKAQVAIAPGILVAPKAYGSGADGVLEAGHEYKIVEPSVENHYEFTMTPVKPLLNGLTENDKTDMVDALNGNKNWNYVLAGTNTVKGGINVAKKVVDENGKDLTAQTTKTSFTFKVTLTDKNGNPVASPETVASGDLGVRIYNADGTEDRTGRDIRFAADGTATVTIKATQTFRVVNVPAKTSYVIEEQGVPFGFALKEWSGDTGTVNGNDSHNAVCTNVVQKQVAYEDADLKIQKIDATTNQPMSNVSFTLTPGADGSESQVLTTGEAGVTAVNFTGTGTYTLTETTPAGYEALNATWTISVSQGEVKSVSYNEEKGWWENIFDLIVGATPSSDFDGTTNTLTVKNTQKTGSIAIEKTDATTGGKLAGAVFTVEGKDVKGQDHSWTLTTDSNGSASLDQIPFGTYTLTEITPPTGYEISFEPKEFTVGPNFDFSAPKTFQVQDAQKTGTIVVAKEDAVTHEALSGAEFTLKSGEEVIATATDNGNGTYTFADVAFGTYTLHEEDAPQGYVEAADQQVTVGPQNVSQTISLLVEDPQMTGTVVVTKKDATTKDLLSGAEFKLAGKSEADADIEKTATDNGDGTYTFTDVPFGTYTLTETKAPTGYNKAAAQTVTIDENNVESDVALTVEDPQKTGTVTVTKKDATTGATSDALAGATFQLKVGEAIIATSVDNNNGTYTFNNVPFGTYTLHESVAPQGYGVADDQEVTVDATNVENGVSVEVLDPQLLGTVEVIKTDATTGAVLANAKFKLTGTTSGNQPYTSDELSTGADGKVLFENVPFGTYTLTETQAPTGYNKAADQQVTVDPTTVVQTISKTMADPQKTGTITVTKKDAKTKEELAGAVFQLLQGEKVVDTQTTNAQGVATFSNVAFGTYVVHEHQAPAGYNVTFVDEEVTISATNVEDGVSVTALDGQKSATVTAIKKDATTNEVLAGAEFTLSGKDSLNDTVNLTVLTDSDGKAVFSNVPFGKYTLTETKAPTGYEPSTEVKNVNIGATNVSSTHEFTFLDAQKKGQITVTKQDAENTSTTLTGAKFELLNADGTKVAESTDNGDGTYTFSNVSFGTYNVTETKAPTGYEVSFQGQEVTIDASNVEAGVSFNVTDKRKTGTVKVTKEDEITGAKLAGAVFTLTAADGSSVSATTDNKGVATFTKVKFGTYTLTETSAPAGYIASTQSIGVEIKASNVEQVATFTVKNTQKTGTVTVNKTDKTTGAKLAGATFTLTGESEAKDAVSMTATDNGDGTYTFTGVPFGTYEVEETAAPTGYELNTTKQSVTIDASNVVAGVSVDVADTQKKGKVKVTKSDATTSAKLAGAKFKLEGNNYSQELTTDSNGVALFENVPFGNYRLTETKAPTGYDITYTGENVTIDANNVSSTMEINVVDGQLTGTVTVTKTAQMTGNALTGATFKLTGLANGQENISKTATDNGDGTYTFENVPFGVYKLTETAAPTGYEITFPQTDVEVTAQNVSQAFSYSAVDKEKTATVTISKTDSYTGAALAGAEFTLVGKDVTGKDYSQTVTTDANGAATITGVPFGTYTLTESKVPAGYSSTFTAKTITIDASTVDSTHHYDVANNELTGTVDVTKTDEQTGSALAGAGFTLSGTTASGASYSTTLTTDAQGKATFTGVPFGNYTLAETTVPTGYTRSFQPQPIELNADNITQTVTVNAVNTENKGSLQVTKKGAINNDLLKGAEFTLSGTTLAGQNWSGKLTTGDDGVGTLTDIPFGSYTLTETKAPEGYELTTQTWTVNVTPSNVDTQQKITVVDGQKTGTVTINKTDAQTHAPLAGATFKLIGKDQGGSDVDMTATDNGDGTYVFEGVPFGTYTVSETAAPTGYTIDFAAQALTVNAANVEKSLTYNAQDNQKKATVTVTKTDSYTGAALAGAEFTLAGSTVTKESFSKTLATDAAGNVTFSNVPFGTYTLTETKVPAGYEGTFAPQTFTVGASNVDSTFHYDVANNELTGTVDVTKTDEQTGSALAGAGFTLSGTTASGASYSTTLTTDAQGKATFTGVPFGNYTLAETTVPTGYTKAFQPRSIELKAENITQTVTVNAVNTQMTGTVEVVKTDAVTGALLKGAEFTLAGKDSAGNDVSMVKTTGNDGTAIFTDVPFGNYRMTETKAPKGYQITYTGENVTIDASNVKEKKTINVADGQKTGSIVISKTDSFTSDELAGATFTLTGRTEGGIQVSKTATDNGDGTYTFSAVPFGTYTVSETAAPAGYDIAFTAQTVTVNASNVESALSYDAVDDEKVADIVIAKTDQQTGNALAGAGFTLVGTDANGDEVSKTVTTDANGAATIEDVPFGNYVLSETTVPDGYTKTFADTDVDIDASNVESTTAFEYQIENTQKTATIHVVKTDEQTGLALAGAVFALTGNDSAGNSVSRTGTTDSQGKIDFTQVPFGTYTLTETAAPAGYTKTFQPVQVTVDASNVTGNFTYAMTNTQMKGSVKVTKSDATTGEKLAGAEFKVSGTTSAGQHWEGTLTTGANGEGTLTQVPFGTYTLTETKAPEGYEITYPGAAVNINATNVTQTQEYSVVDGQKTGSVVISKIDAQTEQPLAGATFKLEGTSTGNANVDMTATDNGDGTYTFSAVPFGTYTLTETAAPTGYTIDFDPVEVKVNAKNVSSALTYNAQDNQKKATVSIAKTDAQTGLALAGAEFTLSGTTVTKESFSKTLATDAAGNVTFTNVPFGTYTLTESKVPAGYTGTFTTKTITIDASTVDSTHHYNVVNTEKTGTIQVTKIDAITKAKLAGATFKLEGTSAAGDPVNLTAVTAATGVATFSFVPFGTYKLTETAAPTGYEVTFRGEDVTVDASNVERALTYEVTDRQKTGTVTVTKTDEVTGALLSGAEFKLTGTSEAKAEVDLTATDNGDGTYTFSDVPFGTYKVTETKAPKGYEVTFEGKEITIDASNVEEGVAFTAKDGQLTGTVTVTKTDEVTGEKLSGAEFKLAGTSQADKAINLTASDNGDGTYTFADVPFGTYEVTETKAPKGYEVTFEGKEIKIDASNVEEGVAFTAKDGQLTGTVTVTKTDEVTGEKLSGAEFKLAGTSQAKAEVDLTATDNGDGTYTFADVPFGTYEVTETKAPKGYEVTFEGKEIKIDASNVEEGVAFTAKDQQKKAMVTVTKADSTTTQKLAGAKFKLEGKDSAGKDYSVEVTTNADGVALFEDVPFGTYTLTETKAPTGYEITFGEQAVEVNAGNVDDTFTYAVTDDQKTGTITVTKTDEVTEAVLAGATFMLTGTTSGKAELNVSAKDNGDGTYTFAQVPFGTYKLTETAAPKGYEISYEGEDVTVDADNVEQTLTYDVADKQKVGKITVTKLDSITQEKLSGAEFKLAGTSQAKAEVDLTATDNGDGTYTFADVPFGTYEVTETKAPKGYEVTFEGKEITIDASNVEEGVAFDATDQQKTGTVEVTKLDQTTKEALAGAEFTLTGTDSAGAEVNMVLTTNDQGVASFTQVPFGAYTLTETKAPTGYEVTFPGAEFTVDASNVEQPAAFAVEATDQQKTATITVTKKDAVDEALLPGAVFKLTGKTFAVEAEGDQGSEDAAPDQGMGELGLLDWLFGQEADEPAMVDYEQTAIDNGDGTYTFTEVPFGTYTLTETQAPQGYVVSFEDTEVVVDASNVETELAYTAVDDRETMSIPVDKSWVDRNNKYQVRPTAITVTLFADGQEVASAELSEATEWSASFDDLEVYKEHGAEAIEYTIEEAAVENYTPEIEGSADEGFLITNTLKYENVQGNEGEEGDDDPTGPGKVRVKSDEGTTTNRAPQTGDFAPIAGVAALAGIGLAGILLLERRKRQDATLETVTTETTEQ